MANQMLSVSRFNGGIAIGDKETITSVFNQNGLNSSYRFGYSINVSDEPSKFSLLPAPKNVLQGTFQVGNSGLVDEPRWIVNGSPYVQAVFAYGSTGRVYQEDAYGVWTYIHTVPNSVGNGMVVFNNYLYCVADTTISSYGPLDGAGTWNDSWQTGLNSTNKVGFAPALVFGFGFAVGHGNNIGFYGNNINIQFSFPVSYVVGDVVSYGGSYYSCILAYTSSNSSTTPDQDSTHWTLYSSSYPPYQWTNTAITLPYGSSVRTLTRIEQYLAIGTIGGNNVFDNENGYIFMWDGSSPQWNFFNNIEQGSCNVVANYRNQLLSINGSQGIIYLQYDPFTKVHQLPFLPISQQIEVYPGAITSWKGKVYIGFGAQCLDSNITRGVYAWGSKVNAYPDAFTCDFLISTGNTGPTVQITAVAGMGNYLYIGWRDGNQVGIDKVYNGDNPASFGRMNYLIFDDARMPQMKKADTIQVYHSNLNPGESIQIFMRINRTDNSSYPFDTTPTYTHTYSATDPEPNVTRWSPPSNYSRFYELEIGVGLGATESTTPYAYSFSMKYNDLKEEERI